MHSIQTGKFLERIPYAKVSTGENPILVINGGQGFMMRPDEARMSKDARRLQRLLPDDRSFILLGYDPDAAKVTVDDLADDVSKIIGEYLGGKVDVMGVSYGGVVASRLAMRWPQKIDKIVLMASAPWFSVEGGERLRRQVTLIDTGDLVALIGQFTSMFRSPWLNLLSGLRVLLSGNRIVQRLGKPEVIRLYLEAMLESERSVDCVSFQSTPMFIVEGTRDQFFAAAIVEASVRAPNIKTFLFEGETHMVPIERAKSVKRMVSDFLSSG